MREEFKRTARLLGEDAMSRLESAHVVLFGVGGVGSYVAEALTRAGVGHLTIVDGDDVAMSNINRQLHALHSTVGQRKVDVMRARMLDINPSADIRTVDAFILPGAPLLFDASTDYVVDAIDTVAAKLYIITQARELGVPVISCMGTGNKLDPTRLRLADIYETSVCPLCRVMRRELKRRGVESLRVLFSDEEPLSPADDGEAPTGARRAVPGSVSFVPSVAGLIIAGDVVRTLANK